ncbi:MAG: MTH938/NDUFAF3 family protein [Pseudomonadota bacterium]
MASPETESDTDRFYPGVAPVDAYGNGGFRFADMSHKGSILCLPNGIRAWSTQIAEHLDESDFRAVFRCDPRPEVLLLGTGPTLIPIPERLRLIFRAEKIGIDAMDTGAAARTYNVLVAEGRRVGAALIAVE